MKTSENCEIKPSRISEPSPKPQKYLYAKIMAYTLFIISQPKVSFQFLIFKESSNMVFT